MADFEFAILGAGAMGSIIGAHLARAGHAVAMLARSERAQALARTIDQSGVRAAATPEIVSLEWSKFCGWVGLTSLSVTTRALTWKLLTDPDSALILARLVREMGVLALAQGIPLSDRSILPTATLCSGSESEAVAILLEAGSEYRTRAPGHRLSALQDLEA